MIHINNCDIATVDEVKSLMVIPEEYDGIPCGCGSKNVEVISSGMFGFTVKCNICGTQHPVNRP